MHCWMTEWRKKRHITQHTYLNTDTRLHCNVLNTEYVTHTHAFQGHKSRWWGGEVSTRTRKAHTINTRLPFFELSEAVYEVLNIMWADRSPPPLAPSLSASVYASLVTRLLAPRNIHMQTAPLSLSLSLSLSTSLSILSLISLSSSSLQSPFINPFHSWIHVWMWLTVFQVKTTKMCIKYYDILECIWKG